MEYLVTIQPSGHVFAAHTNETILEAGLRAGHNLKYQCDNGSCGGCKVRLLKGEINTIKPGEFVVGDAEKEQGYFLPCAHEAISDVEIEAGIFTQASDMPYQEISSRIKKIEHVTDDIVILHLRTPRTKTLRFLAGQSASLQLPDKSERTLQIASCPCNGMLLEFHVRHQANDPFSEYVFERLSSNAEVTVKGPTGEFVLDESSSRPLLFVTHDTGFAGVKSLIEHAIAMEIEQDIHLYRIACKPGDDYLNNVCRSWSDAIDNFHYHALSVECDDEAGSAAYDRLLSMLGGGDMQDIFGSDVYLSGTEPVVENLARRLLEQGLDEEQLKIQRVE